MNLLDSPEMQRDVTNNLVNAYYKHRFVEYLGDLYLTKNRRALEDKERMLNIMAKQRSLGIPMETEDYEQAVNEDKPFYSQLMRSGSKRALQAIPSPSFLTGEKHTPFFKIAESVASELPSFKKIPSKGAKYAGSIGRVASAIFSL